MYQPELLAGRRILITGGGTGLGRSMALRFAELGAQIFLCGRREEPLQETCAEINAGGATRGVAGDTTKISAQAGKPVLRAAYATCDVRDAAAVELMAEAAHDALGGIDTLVNNAAGNFIARTEKLSPNAFNAVVGIVLNGTFHCTQALGRRWISAKQPGNVLNILTTYAETGSGFVVPSACAKAGVLAMTRSLAVEWARHNIRFNAIAPGPFPTEGAFSRLMPSKDYEERTKQQIPMKRFGRHEELANLAVYLLSGHSEYVNGECVVIDGAAWLRGAGEFNDLSDLSDETWDQLEQARKK